jgi:hypothetical protein
MVRDRQLEEQVMTRAKPASRPGRRHREYGRRCAKQEDSPDQIDEAVAPFVRAIRPSDAGAMRS